ncbi:MAG: amidohydrolase family protein [Sphingomicrobium sp.]
MSLLLVFASLLGAPATSPKLPPQCLGVSSPIIDVHSHAYAADARWAARAPNPATGEPLTAIGEEAQRRETNAEYRRRGVIRALVDDDGHGADREAGRRSVSADPVRMRLGIDPSELTPKVLARIRELHAAGELTAIAEVAAQYYGVGPDDPRMEPLWALAEELNLPVGIHMGLGPPGVNQEAPNMRMRLGNPLLLEDVLIHYPKLRVYIMHAGWPFSEELLAMLHSFPNLYVDVAVIDWAIAKPEFYTYLRRIVEAGFGERVMYGSDQMVWPDAVSISIDRIQAAPFLSTKQKRDILFNNAVRFFGWTDLEACRN